MNDASLLAVIIASVLTAVATGLGALPLLFMRDASNRTLGFATATAGGLMLAATQLLLVQGTRESGLRTLSGCVAGVVVIWIIARFIHAHGEPDVGKLRGASARVAFLIIAVMTAHSAAEGIGVGVSFGGGEDLGVLVALAIAIHNIPEGLAISLALVPNGASVKSAAGWSIFSSLPQPLLAIPAFLFVEAFRSALPIGLGVAGGAMLWMVAFELVPEALGRTSRRTVAAGMVLGYVVMLAITIGINPG
ncbi:MAG: zinc/iron permease [Thermoleophilia bacterium]|nr:zinc/iron permease [Thermoleophilia bacterium]